MNHLHTPSKKELFTGFFRIGISGFGGVLPHARRILVEHLRWIDEQEFTHLLGLGQLLPGPNIVNVSVVIGQKFHGISGACLAVGGLMLAPFIIVLLLAATYSHFADTPRLAHALTAIAAGGACLMLATGAKLARGQRRSSWAILIAITAFIAIFWFRLPLLHILAALIPIGLLCGWQSVRKELRATPSETAKP